MTQAATKQGISTATSNRFLMAFITKYILWVGSAAVAGSGTFLYWSHGHAAELQLENRGAINLDREVYRNGREIDRVRDSLTRAYSDRTQVSLYLSPDKPHLVSLKESIDNQITDAESRLEKLLRKQSDLELKQKGL